MFSAGSAVSTARAILRLESARRALSPVTLDIESSLPNPRSSSVTVVLALSLHVNALLPKFFTSHTMVISLIPSVPNLCMFPPFVSRVVFDVVMYVILCSDHSQRDHLTRSRTRRRKVDDGKKERRRGENKLNHFFGAVAVVDFFVVLKSFK